MIQKISVINVIPKNGNFTITVMMGIHIEKKAKRL